MQDNNQELLLSIKQLFETTTDLDQLMHALENYHPHDIAEAFTELSDVKQEQLLHRLPDGTLARILSHVDIDDTNEILEDLEDNKIASILTKMEPDDAADILETMETDKVEAVMDYLEGETLIDIKELAEYEEDTAGSLMNNRFLQVRSGEDVKEAMRIVVKEAPNVEIINTLFIVDQQDRLLGTLDLKKLICTKSPMKVDAIMNSHFQFINVDDSRDNATKKVKNYDTYVMPVVDQGILKGIITMDDAIDAAVDMAEEDYARLAGMTEDQDQDETVMQSTRKRLPWLVILLLLDLVVAVVIAQFEHVIDRITILVFFQAAVLGLAGNCGTQSLAVSVRKIGQDGMNHRKAIGKHLVKEISLGLLTGIILGIVAVAFVTGMLYLKGETTIEPFRIGLVVGIAILIAVTLSNLFGAAVPILFYKCHIDPAVASGPFITTINDILAIIVYFTVAMIVLTHYL